MLGRLKEGPASRSLPGLMDAVALREILGVAGSQKTHGPIRQPTVSSVFQPLQQQGCAVVEIPALRGPADRLMHDAERFYLLQNLGSFHIVLNHLQQKSSQWSSM
jgi:hypothetical protein